MQVRLNFETNYPRPTAEIVADLSINFKAPVVKLRQQVVDYHGPDGPATAHTWVALLDGVPFPAAAVQEIAAQLACQYGQDCVALMIDSWGALAGPAAQRWLPFNPAHFVEY